MTLRGSLLIPAYHQHVSLLPRVFGHILSQTFLGTSSIPNQILPQLFPSDSSHHIKILILLIPSRLKPNHQSLNKYIILLGWSLGILATVFPVPRHSELRCCHRRQIWKNHSPESFLQELQSVSSNAFQINLDLCITSLIYQDCKNTLPHALKIPQKTHPLSDIILFASNHVNKDISSTKTPKHNLPRFHKISTSADSERNYPDFLHPPNLFSCKLLGVLTELQKLQKYMLLHLAGFFHTTQNLHLRISIHLVISPPKPLSLGFPTIQPKAMAPKAKTPDSCTWRKTGPMRYTYHS